VSESNILHNMHCAPKRGSAKGRRRHVWYVSPDGFRELRLSCLLSQPACAKLLGVSLRAIRYWDSGRNRVPWSAVRLLRVLRGGELPASGWDGWRVLDGGRLVTPAGIVFHNGQLDWWSLTCLQARSWQRHVEEQRSVRPSAADGVRDGLPVADGSALDLGRSAALGVRADAAVGQGAADTLPPADLPFREEGKPGRIKKRCRASARPASAPTGLVLLKTSGTPGAENRTARASGGVRAR